MIHDICNLHNVRRLMQAFANSGGDVADVPFGRFVYISETDDSARRELWPTILKLTQRLRAIALNGNPSPSPRTADANAPTCTALECDP